MALTPLTEDDIIDQIYSFYENDSTTWSSTSAEYLTARNMCKAAIIRWEYLEGVRWNELYTTLTAAADGTKTTTALTYTYGAPTNMKVPPQPDDYVRIGTSEAVATYYKVIPLSKVEQMKHSSDRYCYFTGNAKLGFTLNVNSQLTYNTGDNIYYEYWRYATYFTATTSTTEMSNPFFIVHYVLARLYKSDGLLNESNQELQIAENILQEMKAENTDVITDGIDGSVTGFGY